MNIARTKAFRRLQGSLELGDATLLKRPKNTKVLDDQLPQIIADF